MALYHAVIGSDGKVEEVVAGRPIGFGLDESAEQTIRKATFQPAIKDGKPVPVALDVVVSFRIYSKRTSQTSAQAATDAARRACLPGPYTVQAQSGCIATSPKPSGELLPESRVRDQLTIRTLAGLARGGSHNSTRLPSGSQIHANRPYA